MKTVAISALAGRDELLAVQKAEQDLRETLKYCPSVRLGFIYPDGQSSETTELDLPIPVVQLFADLLGVLAQGHGAEVVKVAEEMTTMQAANYLNVARSTVIRLADGGYLAHRMAGNRRLIEKPSLDRHKAKRGYIKVAQDMEGTK
jgi:excisionase family DNA binding protein